MEWNGRKDGMVRPGWGGGLGDQQQGRGKKEMEVDSSGGEMVWNGRTPAPRLSRVAACVEAAGVDADGCWSWTNGREWEGGWKGMVVVEMKGI